MMVSLASPRDTTTSQDYSSSYCNTLFPFSSSYSFSMSRRNLNSSEPFSDSFLIDLATSTTNPQHPDHHEQFDLGELDAIAKPVQVQKLLPQQQQQLQHSSSDNCRTETRRLKRSRSSSDLEGDDSKESSCYMKKQNVACASDAASGAGRNVSSRWTETEEVILQGVVGDCNLVFGTQASWEQIAKCYAIANGNFCAMNNVSEGPVRTSCALKKHYRVMHNRIKEGEVASDFWYRVYQYSWMSSSFNAGQKLINYSKLNEVTSENANNSVGGAPLLR